jgi:hypothetical protein
MALQKVSYPPSLTSDCCFLLKGVDEDVETIVCAFEDMLYQAGLEISEGDVNRIAVPHLVRDHADIDEVAPDGDAVGACGVFRQIEVRAVGEDHRVAVCGLPAVVDDAEKVVLQVFQLLKGVCHMPSLHSP